MRAARIDRILILDGLKRAERNVLPTLKNLMEKSKMHLEDGLEAERQEERERENVTDVETEGSSLRVLARSTDIYILVKGGVEGWEVRGGGGGYRVGQLSLLFSRLVKCQKCFPPLGGQPSPPSTPTPPHSPFCAPDVRIISPSGFLSLVVATTAAVDGQ